MPCRGSLQHGATALAAMSCGQSRAAGSCVRFFLERFTCYVLTQMRRARASYSSRRKWIGPVALLNMSHRPQDPHIIPLRVICKTHLQGTNDQLFASLTFWPTPPLFLLVALFGGASVWLTSLARCPFLNLVPYVIHPSFPFLQLPSPLLFQVLGLGPLGCLVQGSHQVWTICK